MANFIPPIDLGQWKPSSAAISSWLYEIWKYLQANPISTEEELTAIIAERIPAEIADYLAEHPVTAPVTSVNGEVGAVQIAYGDLIAGLTFPIAYPDDISDLSNNATLLAWYEEGARFAFWPATNTLYVLDRVADTVTPVAVSGGSGGGSGGGITSINTTVLPDGAGNAVLTGQNIPVSAIDSTTINNALGNRPTMSAVFDAIYPIGSIYITTANVDPGAIFGGNWDRINGRFLLGASDDYPAGTPGGEASHMLSIDEMPSHTHAQNAHVHEISLHSGTGVTNTGWHYELAASTSGPIYNTSDTTNRAGSAIRPATATNQSTGGGLAHNNMPPYLAVYIWERLA